MDKTKIINEIKLYLNIKTDSEFAEFLGIKQPTIASWKKRNTIDYELIIAKCNNINGHWLLTGQGSMLKEPTQPTSVQEVQPSNNDNEVIVLLKDKISLLEDKESLLKDKIADLERRLAFAEVKDKEEMSLKIKTQHKEKKEKDEIILAQFNN